jgi:hypothetical protein
MSDQKPAAAAAQHQHEAPVSTTLTTSSPTLSLDGQPPFVAITEYECTTSKPIWALVGLFTHVGNGILIRDPQRLVSGKPRRIGPTSTIYEDDWDDKALDLEETELVRLEPGRKFSTSYTISVVPKVDGLRGSDTYAMVKGNTYEISLRKRRWRWMYENGMGEGLSKEEWRELLSKKDPMEWDVDCKVNVTAI